MLAQTDGGKARDVEHQCLMRTANEALERTNEGRTHGTVRGLLRCECDDPACAEVVAPTHAEYEAVRASGSQFIVAIDHENPENACVLSESDSYAVIDVVVADARYAARARNPRHSWVGRTAADPLVPRDAGPEGGTK